jgi:formate C-acetyltransferase
MSVAEPKIEKTAWRGFRTGLWVKEIDVRDFIQQNYEPYDGDGSFLASATPRTQKIWTQIQALFVEERRKGVLDISQIPSSIPACSRASRQAST